MKKHSRLIFTVTFILMVLLSACGSNVPVVVTSTPAPILTFTNTPDPCGPDNIGAEAQKVHTYMREFDDAANLAASLPREQVADAIANLQRIRRESEDQVIPPCLGNLKTYQINHMNTVINVLIALMRGLDQQVISQGVNLAGQQHDQYLVELARVMGLTIEPATVIPLATDPAITETPSPSPQ